MMNDETKVKFLQMFYAAALADSTLRFTKEGLLEKITAEKYREQLAGGKTRAQQLGIESPAEVFEKLPEIFGCADWTVEQTETGFSARASRCMLCALAKKMGAGSPCHIYCLDAMEGMVRGLEENAGYQVESTLWQDGECRVRITGCGTMK